MLVQHLGRMPYHQAWTAQQEAHASVLAGGCERLLLVEHPPVITFGRRPGAARHLLAQPSQLQAMGVQVVHSDRGGDVTFHGPGQIVAYPIMRLADHNLSVGGYVRLLLEVVIATLERFGIVGRIDPAAIGVWVEHEAALRKICALGVRVRRGVSMHGIALNVSTDLRWFDLIVPCGLSRPVTSMQQVLGDAAPSMEAVTAELTRRMEMVFGQALAVRDN
jgi:lipoyl(octanoyl) transferase